MAGSDDASWSRAFMATSGLPLTSSAESSPRPGTAEWHEAGADGLGAERMRRLAAAKDPAVREAIAARRDCPMGLLASLAHDRRVDVRIAAAANPRSTRAILEHLAHDRESSVLKAVARNESTPVDIVEALAFHKRDEVRRVASRRLDEITVPPGSADPAPGLPALHLPPELADRVAAQPMPSTRETADADAHDDFGERSPTTLAPRPMVPTPRQSAATASNAADAVAVPRLEPDERPGGWVPTAG